eukprot:CAMPEP_0197174016 /NCGR_PEP_ID=MMETSP1423-20130617/722_1 /TAXON_ID=476441 /ORGANISM="Pseudo-nitzschia heimii, Strain UNC1101" /LENGTH=510 /DNA_ID=CAMNT_0042622905 /DNA_START=184 /DNA_END=1716 /DNA_ORIENTATION=+
MATPTFLVLLLSTILVISQDATGFVAPSAHSSRVTAIATQNSKSTKSPVFLASIGASADNESDTDSSPPSATRVKKASRNPLKMAYRIYTGYAKKLWRETDPSERSKIANDRVAQTIRDMQHVLTSEHETISSSGSSGDNQTVEASENLLQACEHMLSTIDENEKSKSKTSSTAVAPIDADGEKGKSPPVKAEKKQRSILFGAVMGIVVAAWVFSGNYIFTGLFCLLTILGQLEYYRMIMNTGVFPARRISVAGATSMFVTALCAPDLHQLCLPTFATWAMIWKLTMRRKIATIPEIATTFTGMFYLGYVPSFWVRIRTIGSAEMMEPTRLFPATLALRNFLEQKFGFLVPKTFVHLPITSGAVFIFWSWISLAFSDVGAYFVGRKFGKTKLGTISPAAGSTSPNKSVEGVIGGCIASSLFSIAGAWAQKWPHFILTGALHGTILALLGLIGDLTASMLKRDAGLKDFGDLIPEHGGIMDRVDSFVWTAPYSWFVCAYIIPALKAATTVT